VFNSALFDDVPHFASKHLAERVIDAQALPAISAGMTGSI
jgi:hypothetical protein